MKPRSDNEFAAFVGIDWADAKHDICLQAADSEQGEFDVPHRPESIEASALSLKERFPGRPIAVCLELEELDQQFHERHTVSIKPASRSEIYSNRGT